MKLPPHDVSSPRRPLIMGIVNVNDDSFSGDGSLDTAEIVSQCREQIAQGADIIDLGAESARTNRAPITVEDEIDRLLPVLAQWGEIISASQPIDREQLIPPVLSINTWRPEVIQALLSGAYASHIGLFNDMSALAYSQTLPLIAQSQASLLIMHSVGLPKQSHTHQEWDDILAAVQAFFDDKLELAQQAGIPRERIILDPGLDFAKQTPDSLRIIKHLKRFANHDCGVLLPLSRKTFIGESLSLDNPLDRDAGTLACLPYLDQLPNSIVRVHNVRATYQALKVLYGARRHGPSH